MTLTRKKGKKKGVLRHELKEKAGSDMKLSELMLEQQLIVQLIWGDQKIEFNSKVLETDENGAYVTVYLHNEKPLEINIDEAKDVWCNIFADDPATGSRISWKNVKVSTLERNGASVYQLRTSSFNEVAKHDDRRKHTRIKIRKNAKIYNAKTDTYTDIMIHDISDNGVSIYAPQTYSATSSNILILFSDSIDDKTFDIRLECSIIRSQKKVGTVFHGCRILGENKDYLLYGFLKRLKMKDQ